MKYLLLCMGLSVCVVGGVWAQETTKVVPLKPLQSSSLVMRNDCGLSMTNHDLLIQIHGLNGTTALSANDITTAYNWTVGHPDCGGKKSQYNEPSTTSLVANLCTIALLKLEGTAEKYGLQSYQQAKKLQQTLAQDGTNPDGALPGTVKEVLSGSLGPVRVFGSYTSPEKCGIIDLSNGQGLKALYQNMSDSISNIATDCGSSIAYTPRWMTTRISMIKAGQTPYVFGTQQGINAVTNDIDACRDRINESYNTLINQSQVVSTLSTHRYTVTNAQEWMDYIDDKERALSESLGKAENLISAAAKDTPTTPVCVAKNA